MPISSSLSSADNLASDWSARRCRAERPALSLLVSGADADASGSDLRTLGLDLAVDAKRFRQWDWHRTLYAPPSQNRFVLCPRGMGSSPADPETGPASPPARAAQQETAADSWRARRRRARGDHDRVLASCPSWSRPIRRSSTSLSATVTIARGWPIYCCVSDRRKRAVRRRGRRQRTAGLLPARGPDAEHGGGFGIAYSRPRRWGRG